MSGKIRRSDLRGDSDTTVTDDTLTFKKAYQTVGRPPVVENINEQYAQDPPRNEPLETSSERKTLGKKWGAYDEDLEQAPKEQVLGDQPGGRTQKWAQMSDMAQESSVHPNSSGDA
ncbi:hypothetical protein PsYK624_049110 [Phanerochaete sordida]|uniref:Uncharacterized protein n=1 Tax=Phanerochaete sordida TaxID=48140 RepID=A0A9P3LBR7_9APHY|nr:hypothetical protein PsYK624_049110 [Phanerochaete sordida]